MLWKNTESLERSLKKKKNIQTTLKRQSCVAEGRIDCAKKVEFWELVLLLGGWQGTGETSAQSDAPGKIQGRVTGQTVCPAQLGDSD